MNELMNMEH